MSGAQPSLLDLLRDHAARAPDAPCLAFDDETLTFGELDARSSRVANALIDAGVGPGDRVAIVAKTSLVPYELVFGCAKARAVMMPLNWRLSPREIAAILADGTPRLILLADELSPLLGEAVGQPDPMSIEAAYPAWRDAASAVDPMRAHAAIDPLLLLYTSGTTGHPKGVVITNRNLSFAERTAREAWDFSARSVNLVAMPLFHIGGIGYGMMALSQGGKTVLLQQPEPAAVLAVIDEHHVTHAFFVPTVIARLVDHAQEICGVATPTLERILYGAAPIGSTLLARAIATFGCGFSHAYGMTETAGTVITLPPEDHVTDGEHARRLRSCGRPLPWVELALVDPESGAVVETGTVGEIRIRSGMVMTGYWRKPDETAAAITADGWLCTGDAAYRDADGYVYIHDRYKDMIVSGGENIYPTELENVLADHPHVAEVAVIGVAHEQWGETPRAYVVARDAAPDQAALIAFSQERLARYKCPTSVVFVETLPRNASGKILKGALRELDGQREREGA